MNPLMFTLPASDWGIADGQIPALLGVNSHDNCGQRVDIPKGCDRQSN